MHILQQHCQRLLVELVGRNPCWACVGIRRLISLAGWDRCSFIVSVPYTLRYICQIIIMYWYGSQCLRISQLPHGKPRRDYLQWLFPLRIFPH